MTSRNYRNVIRRGTGRIQKVEAENTAKEFRDYFSDDTVATVVREEYFATFGDRKQFSYGIEITVPRTGETWRIDRAFMNEYKDIEIAFKAIRLERYISNYRVAVFSYHSALQLNRIILAVRDARDAIVDSPSATTIIDGDSFDKQIDALEKNIVTARRIYENNLHSLCQCKSRRVSSMYAHRTGCWEHVEDGVEFCQRCTEITGCIMANTKQEDDQ